uniref:C2H2-type domain-containing protein n=1 Tax=Steinernema glaseri TaxID=37863 RepID=A0A1I7YNM5_9BILA
MRKLEAPHKTVLQEATELGESETREAVSHSPILQEATELGQSETREAVPPILRLNTSIIADFHAKCIPSAEALVDRFLHGEMDRFLHGETLPDPSFGTLVLPGSSPKIESSEEGVFSPQNKDYQTLSNAVYRCELCQKDVHGKSNWDSHLKGKQHKSAVKRDKRKEGQEGAPEKENVSEAQH